MKTLGRLMNRLDTLMASAAFAEEGEFETAREIMEEEITKEKRDIAPVEKSVQISIHAVEA